MKRARPERIRLAATDLIVEAEAGDQEVTSAPTARDARPLLPVTDAERAPHGRERLDILRVRDGILALHLMCRPDEIRDPSQPAPPELTEPEAEARQALDLMAALNASVQKARTSRGEGEAEVHEMPHLSAVAIMVIQAPARVRSVGCNGR
ncbi:hypothetical protein GCM10020367_61650 [Streptomyces sannanensis]|uniref:Uncharacterized protein n=1 Tax=Streptomyces sannanensis TaxID=285536 RepID=A0ABP6SL68_9ACTN